MASEPCFYIIRPGAVHSNAKGDLCRPYSVPLIPMDMLPECLEVEGVRRHLTWEETAGMQNLGLMPPAREPLRIRFNTGECDENAVVAEEEIHQIPTPNQYPQSTGFHGETQRGEQSNSHVDKSRDQPTEYSSENTCSDLNPKPQQGLASSRHNITVNLPSPATSACSSSLDHDTNQTKQIKYKQNKAQEVKRASQPSSKTQQRRNARDSGVCQRFVIYNSCKYGNMCRFKHELLPNLDDHELPSLYTYVKTGRLPTMPSADSHSSVSSKDGMGKAEADMQEPVRMEAWTEDGKVEEAIADLIDFSSD